jgi:serine/threonine protein kinase
MPGVSQKIGRFEIRRQLGEGSFGAVYLAYDPDLDREVALKIPGGMTPASRAEFLKEARAAAKIMHPNVCQVFEVSKTDDNPPFIVSRFVGGGTLADYIRKANGNLPVADALKIAGKIASGLSSAHLKGIVHRDLKPGNILYDEESDDFLITDFGLAKVIANASQSSGGVKGTPLYMSPEQFGDGHKAGDVGLLSDVYSLGVILYELLTGEPPFAAGPPLAVMFAHIQTQPTPPSQKRANLGTRYDALCLKSLAKNAHERFPTVKEFGDEIRNAFRPVAPPPLPTQQVAPKPAPARKPGDLIELALPGGVKMPFAYCPSGEFLMGSPEREILRQKDELQHRVVISKGFYMGVGPVTRGQFARFVAETNYKTEAETVGGYQYRESHSTHRADCSWRTTYLGGTQSEGEPVVVVSWNDAINFCAWASKACQHEVRLPTEAEWEYACRGGTVTPYYCDSVLQNFQANFGGVLARPSLVGSCAAAAPHPWGLCDVHGNVNEWCQDWYDEKFYSRSPVTDPRCEDAGTGLHVARGGSFVDSASGCRAARRNRGRASCNAVGFRVLFS